MVSVIFRTKLFLNSVVDIFCALHSQKLSHLLKSVHGFLRLWLWLLESLRGDRGGHWLNVHDRGLGRGNVSESWTLGLLGLGTHLSPEGGSLPAVGLADLLVKLVTLLLIQVPFHGSVVNLCHLLVSPSVSKTSLVDDQECKDHGQEAESSPKDAAPHVVVEMSW